jgi:TRAP-type C4-dicarboxylate transport system substrate-binding protein
MFAALRAPERHADFLTASTGGACRPKRMAKTPYRQLGGTMIAGQETSLGRKAMRLAAAVAATLLALSLSAQAQSSKAFVMKLTTATINDTQHEWLRRFAAMVEKDSGGRITPEIYTASQLGPIPRQIEGVQFGSIQAWMGPPEFLVGIDKRFEALSAPGLFGSQDQAAKVIEDPAVRDLMFGLGASKGLEGIGFAPIGGSAIATRKEVHHLGDFKGSKIRVLASPFQLELIRRMDASPVAMTLGDVLPALQQGAIDGALSTITVFTTFQYVDVTKYVVEVEQPYLSSITAMSKKWLTSLPPDLQKIVRDDALKVSDEIGPFVKEFYAKQRDIWKEKGGSLISLPAAEQASFVSKVSSIGEDLSRDNPDLNKAVKLMFEIAKRHQ